MRRTARIAALVALLTAPLVFDGETQAVTPAHPNVVVFVLDTLRADSFAPGGKLPGRYGEVVEAGTVFTHAQSTGGWTIPSMASMFTGQWAHHHGVTKGKVPGRTHAVQQGDEVLPLPRMRADRKVLPERFQEAGYTTFGTSSNALLNEEQGFHRGFDHYMPFSMKDGVKVGDGTLKNAEGWSLEDRGKAPVAADVLLKQVADWQDEMAAAESWLLWVHLMDSHMPYMERAPWYQEGPTDDDSRWSAYRSSFAWQAQHISATLAALGPDTLVVFVSDHGELMGEKGLYGHPGEAGLPSQLLDIPFIFSGPGIRSGEVSAPVSLADLAPTLTELCGLAPQDSDGRSLVPALQGKALSSRPVYSHRGQLKVLENDAWSVVDWPWKLYRKGTKVQLYNLEKDPGEATPVTNAQVSARLGKLLDEQMAGTVAPEVIQEKGDFDDETMKGLEALGYIE